MKITYRRTSLVRGTNPVSAVEVNGTTYGYITKFHSANQRGGTAPTWRWYDTDTDLTPRSSYDGTRDEAARFFLRRIHRIPNEDGFGQEMAEETR